MFGGACMSEKLDFYEVNVDYVKYLKQFDSRIPNVEYQNRNKFLCGTLFKINGLNYFAPVSSFNIKQSSNYVIEVGNVPVGSVRYSFMFPVPDAEIKQKVEIDFILDGHLEQGYGYKNFKAYNRDVYETSYISEYGYEEYKKQIQEAINHYNKNEFTLEELADSVKEAEKDNGYSHKDFLVLTNYQEEISSHLFDAVDWQYPDTLFDEWIDGNEINKIGNKYIFTAGMELNDFLKMEYLKDFQQGNVNILGVDGKKYISLEDLVNFDVDRYSEKCLNVVYENEKRESQMQEKIMQFHFNLEFVNKKYKNADVVLKVWATEICREQGLSDYYPVQDVKDAFKTMEYIDEKEAVEIVLNDSEETLIYHKSPEEEYFTREALKHETINFDKESEIEEDLDELEK